MQILLLEDMNKYVTRCDLHSELVIINMCRIVTTPIHISEPDITVGHWPLSDQFQDLVP